jgi:hypothetical protein
MMLSMFTVNLTRGADVADERDGRKLVKRRRDEFLLNAGAAP